MVVVDGGGQTVVCGGGGQTVLCMVGYRSGTTVVAHSYKCSSCALRDTAIVQEPITIKHKVTASMCLPSIETARQVPEKLQVVCK